MPESVLRFRVETADANRKVAKLEDQVRKLEIALKKTGGSSRKAATGLEAFGKGAGAAGVSAKALGAAVKGIIGPLSLVASAAGAVVAGFKGFVEADKARAAVKTLGVESKALEAQLVGVVARTGGLASTNQLLAASYDVASAGFSKAADITKILEASLLGAVGGMTDIATVSDAATSVMNAFGLTTDSVSKIVDGFVQTQNDGKIVVSQYASQIGRVAPIAAAAGVGIDELNAAISAVTASGVPVESTFSGINQVIASVVKPTAEAAKAAKRLGLDFSSAAIKTKGFGGFLEDLIEKTGGSEVEITKLFGSVDALKALMPLVNDDLVRFNKNLDNQKNATGAAGDAADIMGETVSSQISRIVNNITTLVRSLDQVLGPAIKGLLAPINAVLSAATAAVAKLSELGMMQRARAQATREMGGVNRRGRFTGDVAARDARALEIYEAAMAQQAAAGGTKDTSEPPPVNQIVPTGNLESKVNERVDMSDKLLELNQRLRQEQELGNERESATLELMVEKQKISEQDLLANERTNKLEQATHKFRQKIFAIDQQAAALADRERKKREADEQAKREADPGFQMKQQLEELLKLENQVAAGATAIGNAFANSFVSVVKGSKTAQEALADMMASIAEHFLQMAAKIIAQQVAMIIYGTIMKALGVSMPGGGGGNMGGGNYFDPMTGKGVAGPNFGLAEGGFVSGPTNALIGEGGEAEYVIPESKMRTAMSRYSRGARGAAVIPENGEGGTSSETGAAAVAAPIDVRFSVERINQVDYVTAEQFQAGMQRAAKQGAVEGERRALGSIRNSSAVRRRIGV